MKLYFDGQTVGVYSTLYPGGEVHVRVCFPDHEPQNCTIVSVINSPMELMTIILATDAVRRMYPEIRVKLACPYLPYARQDRVCYPGESLSLKVVCDMINAQKYDSVEVWDVHSDVSLALLDRVIHRPACDFMDALTVLPDVVVVSPDAGAIKRAAACSKALRAPLVFANKVRNPDNGEITDTAVNSEHIGNKNFLIIDDIADGGRTFIELAKVLRPLTDGKIWLYVTHGIFSNGYCALRRHIDHIYVAHLLFPDHLPSAKFVTIIQDTKK